jgi:hypothetical protein
MSVPRELRAYVSNIIKSPYVGEIVCVIKADTDEYYKMLTKRGVSRGSIYDSVAEAEDAMVSNRGDVMLVFPGDHAVTSEIAWDKNQTYVIGCGGVNQRQQPATLTTGGIRFTCTTANVGFVLNVTGSYCSFYNIGTLNNYADTDNLGDICVASRNFYAENCTFRGGNTTTQVQSATSGIPVTIDAGYAARFVNCQIGQSGNATRTTGPGFAYFRGTGGAHGGIDFINCDFQMRSETTGANPSGFVVAQNSLDRTMRFIGSSFYNFSENWGALPDYMFNIDQTTTFDIILMGGCSMMGFDIVSDSARVKTSDPIPHTNGIEALAVATS